MSKLIRGAKLSALAVAATTTPKNCHFKDAKCYCYGKVGHLARLCRAKKKGKQPLSVNEQKSGNSEPVNLLEGAMQTPREDRRVGAYSLFNFSSQRPSPYKVQLIVAGQPLEMEADTATSLSMISEEVYNYLFFSRSSTPTCRVRNCPSHIYRRRSQT